MYIYIHIFIYTVCIPMGDGQKVKPLKVEWATQTNGKLLIGSTGVRERERKSARERGGME